jgi:hypothetical protein
MVLGNTRIGHVCKHDILTCSPNRFAMATMFFVELYVTENNIQLFCVHDNHFFSKFMSRATMQIMYIMYDIKIFVFEKIIFRIQSLKKAYNFLILECQVNM